MEAVENLKMTAGNFYVNDKSTGAIVGQQAFGGGRHSGIITNIGFLFEIKRVKFVIKSFQILGTNDKAGGPHYCLRWSTPQSVKETFVPLHDVTYTYMNE